VEVIPFSLEAAEHYASIRAKQSISAPDAIHLACAATAGTDLFLTNDRALAGRVIPGIQFIAGLDSDII
jgi:predicted nucleic acid-binding protein